MKIKLPNKPKRSGSSREEQPEIRIHSGPGEMRNPRRGVSYTPKAPLTSTTKKFISDVSKDYPDFKVKRGPREHWSPKSNTITFNPSLTPERIRFGILHELAHAQLGHANYRSDFELLKMESEAWHLASKIGLKYGVTISEDHIQNCLDTYRDWLHHRSQCPVCDMHVLQESGSSYRCFNCGTSWRVSSGRFVRPYRLTKNRQQ